MYHHERPRRSRPTHRQPGKVRWGSFLWVCSAVVFVLSFATTLGGFCSRNLFVTKMGAIGLGCFLVLSGIAFLSGLGLSCCVCANPVLTVKSRLPKSAKAVRFPLGYQLGIAFPALFTGKFRCMYCGEKISLSPRPQVAVSSPMQVRADKPICTAGGLPKVRKISQSPKQVPTSFADSTRG